MLPAYGACCAKLSSSFNQASPRLDPVIRNQGYLYKCLSTRSIFRPNDRGWKPPAGNFRLFLVYHIISLIVCLSVKSYNTLCGFWGQAERKTRQKMQ